MTEGLSTSDEALKTLLLEGGFLDENELRGALEQAQASQESLETVLLDQELLTDTQLGQLMANEAGVAFVNLKTVNIPDELLGLVPEAFVREHYVLPYKKDAQGLHVAMNQPSDVRVLDLLKKKLGPELVVHYATQRDLKQAFNLFKKDQSGSIEALAQALSQEKTESTGKDDSKLVDLVNQLLEYAYLSKASDLHIEPTDDLTVIRFRVDGVLSDRLKLPKALHERILTRLKVMAHLRTDEHFTAQDGHLRTEYGDENVDIRLSILPTTFGEKAVMRLLSEKSRQFSLEEIGLTAEDLELVKQEARKPWGMILVTGPTGSGKSTSLYAIMKILNQRSVNISTIEDPVEYSIRGVNQVQVNPKTELTFSKGLRSLVRQDPDIIMVGEIRDQETADIAVNAALTGHLLLSTLHTNDAATALPRLLDMDVEPFLVASTVNAVMAQRLVRRICPSCIESHTVRLEEIQEKGLLLPKTVQDRLFAKGQANLYRGKGCELCHHQGYLGRIGVFEILQIDGTIKKMILEEQSSDVIKDYAVQQGMRTMMDDAVQKAIQGQTTLEEVLRVVRA